MELTVIRDKVLTRLIKMPYPVDTFSVDEVDDAINYVQDTYIQPAALVQARADHTVRGDLSVEDESNALDATNTIYTATHSPFKHGTFVIVKADGTQVTSDQAGFEHTVDYETGQVVFDAAQTAAITVTYVAEERLPLSDLAADIYEIDYIRDITRGLPGLDVSLLEPYDNFRYQGVQLYNGVLKFRNIDARSVLRFYYYQRLSRLGSGPGEVDVPEIDARWHDLYWKGAIAQFDETKYPLFMNRLSAFELERIDEVRQVPVRQKMNW